MKQEKEFKISFWAAHATTIVSVSLVLLLVGIIAMISVTAQRETSKIKESVEISAIMDDDITNAQASQTLDTIKSFSYVINPRLITKEEAMKNWKEETGEDLEEVFGVNPLSPEISFSVKDVYSNPDSIQMIEKRVRNLYGVTDVAMPDAQMLQTMNENIETISVVMGIIAIVMLVISFVLINNTVRLTIYSRRFTIHTMQLVGATNSFISRPIIFRNMLAGVIAGIVAAGAIAVALALSPTDLVTDMSSNFQWIDYAIIGGSIIVGGGLICAFAAWMATSRYLRKDYGELFK